MRMKNARRRLPLLMLSLLLTSCATNLPPPSPVQPAQIPPPPQELMQAPDLSQTYSDIVRKLLLDWQQRLTDWKRRS